MVTVNITEFVRQDGSALVYKGTDVVTGRDVFFQITDLTDAYEINEALMYNDAPLFDVDSRMEVDK